MSRFRAKNQSLPISDLSVKSSRFKIAIRPLSRSFSLKLFI